MGWVVNATSRPHFTPGKDAVPIVQEAGWDPGPVWTVAENIVQPSPPQRDSIPGPSSPYRVAFILGEDRKNRDFKSMALKMIFEPKRDKVTSEWRRIHNEDIYNVYSTPNITRAVKLGRKRWARHAARIRGRGQMRAWFWCGNLRQVCRAENLGVDGSIILK